jgi:hypothetical protein
MPLVKPPTLTPAKLAACRANAQKSTGPRTPEGKRRIVFNSLKHGERSRDFLSTLLKAGSREEKESYLELHYRLEPLLQPTTPGDRKKAEDLLRQLWCTQRLFSRALNRPQGLNSPSKRKSPLESEPRRITIRSGIQVVVPWGRLTFHLCLRRGRGPNRLGTRGPSQGPSPNGSNGPDGSGAPPGNRRRKMVYWTVRIYRHKARSQEAWLAANRAALVSRPASPGAKAAAISASEKRSEE